MPDKEKCAPLDQSFGMDFLLKIGAVFSLYFVTQGFSYALGRSGCKLSALITASGFNPAIEKPDFYLSLTAGAFHLSNIVSPTNEYASWPLLPVVASALLFYACFLSERLRDAQADAVNLAFFVGLAVALAMLLVGVLPRRWFWMNLLILFSPPTAAYVAVRHFAWQPLPAALHRTTVRHAVAAIATAVVLIVGFVSSYWDGYNEPRPGRSACEGPVLEGI